MTPDFRAADVQAALDGGEVTVYSSYPIEQGTFVTPSRMEAQNYAGDGAQVYSRRVPLSDVAWIDEVQGQYTGPVGENTRAVEMPVMGESAPSAFVREGNIIRRDTSTATPGDAMTWQDVYNYESRSDAPAEVTQEPVSAADRAEMDAYMDALAQDENILTDDPYTPADAVYDAQLRRCSRAKHLRRQSGNRSCRPTSMSWPTCMQTKRT